MVSRKSKKLGSFWNHLWLFWQMWMFWKKLSYLDHKLFNSKMWGVQIASTFPALQDALIRSGLSWRVWKWFWFKERVTSIFLVRMVKERFWLSHLSNSEIQKRISILVTSCFYLHTIWTPSARHLHAICTQSACHLHAIWILYCDQYLPIL